MKFSAARRLAVIGMCGAVALTAAACGSESDASDGDGPVEITLASQPNGAGLSMYIAKERGYFEEEGLKVEVANYASGPASLSAGASDEWQAGWLGAPPALTGANTFGLIPAGLMIREDANHVMIMDKAALAEVGSPADLLRSGPVATSQNSLAEQVMRACAEDLGVPADEVEIVPLDGGQVVQALLGGEVEIANSWASPNWPLLNDERFEQVCDGESAGVAVVDPFVVTPTFAEENPEAAAAFLRAAFRGNDFINENPDEAVDYMEAYYKQYGIEGDRAQAEHEVTIRTWLSLEEAIASIEDDSTADALKASAEFFVKNGVYATEPPIDELLADGLELLEAARDGSGEAA